MLTKRSQHKKIVLKNVQVRCFNLILRINFNTCIKVYIYLCQMKKNKKFGLIHFHKLYLYDTVPNSF